MKQSMHESIEPYVQENRIKGIEIFFFIFFHLHFTFDISIYISLFFSLIQSSLQTINDHHSG